MIVEHAFRRVKDLVFGDPEAGQILNHEFEIAVRRLVGAEILGCIGGVEGDA